jgi:hypothetical protein|tara:strand:+ start:604 stop:873 length:270 start_codon:yes stop_codon:yes gene_type:complete
MTVTEAKNVVVNRLTGTALLPEKEHRKKLIIQNTHASNILYVKFVATGTVDSSVANYDIQIPGKANFVLDNYTGPVKAGATTVNYTELG